MKITRTSGQTASLKAEENGSQSNVCECVDVNANAFAECENYIRSAINTLGSVAKDDVKAREAIANLSVVLFDIK